MRPSTLWDQVGSSAILTLGDHLCERSLKPDTGHIVLDGEGRVIDNTIFAPAESSKQAWLDSLADYRWPCLAGESIPFTCVWGTY
jgi:hypothetical protein